MKKLLLAVLITLSFSALYAKGEPEVTEKVLTVYAYDSFISEWGPGPVIEKGFEEKTGIQLEFVSTGDAGAVLNQLIMEKDNPQADVIIGLDNNLLSKAVSESVLETYASEELAHQPDFIKVDEKGYLNPFDYGYFAICYDSEALTELPGSLEDLTSEKYRDSIILMDPRTSSPGLGFLLWTIDVYGDDFTEYWKRLMPNILTITDGWDSGYGLFTSGEAPMVLSYTTSPPYHVEYEETERYGAFVFSEGNYMQVEGAAIVKGTGNRKEAEMFIDYLLAEEAQGNIPLTNFMFPANSKTELPGCFDFAPKPEKSLIMESSVITDNLDTWIKEWVKVVSN